MANVRHEVYVFFTILSHCVGQSIRYPRTQIGNLGNPRKLTPQSPVPWWGSIGVLLLGIGAWICGDVLNIIGLCEAARAMVYIPLGNLFGMTIKLKE